MLCPSLESLDLLCSCQIEKSQQFQKKCLFSAIFRHQVGVQIAFLTCFTSRLVSLRVARFGGILKYDMKVESLKNLCAKNQQDLTQELEYLATLKLLTFLSHYPVLYRNSKCFNLEKIDKTIIYW